MTPRQIASFKKFMSKGKTRSLAKNASLWKSIRDVFENENNRFHNSFTPTPAFPPVTFPTSLTRIFQT